MLLRELRQMSKQCTKCNETKALDAFYMKAGKPRAACKDCHNASQKKPSKEQRKAWAEGRTERDPDYNLKKHVKYAYGLSWDEYRALMANGCEVCGSYDRLCVDHNHECCPGSKTCGKCIRGALCHKCNRTEGLFTADELIALAAYMIKTQEAIQIQPKETAPAEPAA